jgi:hypothetical protein
LLAISCDEELRYNGFNYHLDEDTSTPDAEDDRMDALGGLIFSD